MTYKTKTREEVQAIAYKDQEGDFWVSEEEEEYWQNDEYHTQANFYSVIEGKSSHFDTCVSNDKTSRYYIDEKISDTDFKKIFGWISKYQITKESHPEYFI